jgi:vitamin B12 transporter
MKSPKGFKGKYFSLAAITATVATVTLQAQTVSAQQVTQASQEYTKEAHEEDVLLEVDEAPVVVISKKITSQKASVVSATKTPTSPTNLTDNVTIITAEELSLRGATTLKDALAFVPGLSAISNGALGQTTSIFMQGMGNKYTLVLIDGVRFNDPSNTSGSNIAHLLLDNVERIEIIRGAQSGVWGADAAAGVINIITKEAKPGFNGSVNIEAGSYGYKHGAVQLSYRTPLTDASLSASRVLADGPTAKAPRGKNSKDYEDDPYRNTTVHVKVGHWITPDNRVEAGYRDVNAFTHYDENADLVSSGRLDYRSRLGHLGYTYFVGRHTIDAKVSVTKSTTKDLDIVFSPWFNQVEIFKGKTTTAELKDTLKYGDKNALTLGASFEEREVKYTILGESEKNRDDNNRAIYANNVIVFNGWNFSQALRYDAFNTFQNKTTGKLGLSYAFSPDVSVYINGGTAYKAPSILDMVNPWGASNFDLEPEKIRSYNAGVHFHALHVNVFRNEIKNMILWDGGMNKNLSGTSVFKGIEISLEQAIAKDWLMGASYTYTDARDGENKRAARVPRYQASTHVTYVPTKELRLTALGNYIGSRPDKDYSTWPATDVDTGRYFLAHLKADYTINNTWSVYGKLNNLFDRKYQEVDGYATLGRSVYVGVKATF